VPIAFFHKITSSSQRDFCLQKIAFFTDEIGVAEYQQCAFADRFGTSFCNIDSGYCKTMFHIADRRLQIAVEETAGCLENRIRPPSGRPENVRVE
jgi:hypothetical protein